MSATLERDRNNTSATAPTPVPLPVFMPGVTAKNNFYMMTQNPQKVVSENKVSKYDYVHHLAA